LIASNTAPNAEKTVHYIRGLVENDKVYQLLYPDRIPNFNRVRWSDRCACLCRSVDHPEGTFEAIGVGSNVIRRHYNVIIEDDTVAPKKDELTGEDAMPSRDDIEKAIGFHKLTIPLLINFGEDKRIVVGTRWASYDLINFVKSNEKFDVFDKPAYTDDGKPRYKKFNIDVLDAIKLGMGSHMFSSLYLNQPMAKENMMFNPDWIRYYTDEELPKDGMIEITIDPADPPTGKSTQNYSAFVACLHSAKGMFVIDYKRKRFTDDQIINEAFNMADRLGAVKIRVEIDKYANLEHAFRDKMEARHKYYVIDAVKTRGKNKVARIMGLAPLFEAGNVYIKRGMRELEQELLEFPNGTFDDIIDALAWQLKGHKLVVNEIQKKKVKPNFAVFSFDSIRESMHGRHIKYPFQIQLKDSVN